MDSEESPEKVERGFIFVLLRICVAVVFPIICFFILSVSVVFVAFFIGELSIPTPISFPSQCKIVSSTVDLRSSKVCELGLLNYRAKHVSYPFGKSKFRCHYDYYWASVFKVEYKDHALGQIRSALAEAPNEALPLYCRPNFGAAWLTKDKFKVNETYDCGYTSGISRVRLYPDIFFSCQAKDPSTSEMIRRYSILFTKILDSWFSRKSKAKFRRWDVIAGAATGFLTSLITISVFRLLTHMKSLLPRASPARIIAKVINTVRFKRACFLVVYFSVTGWLAVQYWKKLSLHKIFSV